MSSAELVIVAWTHVPRRQQDLARVLGGVLLIPTVPPAVRAPLLRYIYAAMVTTWSLTRLRPKAVLVTAPPVPAALLVYLLSRIIGYRFLLDSHPGAFGLMGDHLSGRLRRVHDFLLSRAAYVGVTTNSLADRVRSVGGRPGLLHEAPPADSSQQLSSDYVLFAGSGGRDEPYDLVFDLARLMPQVKFVATGQPDASLGKAPENVRLTGWLEPSEFESLLRCSAMVLVLSDEKESVMRTAYEAAYADRPLVVSRTPATEAFFPHAIHVANEPQSIAAGIRRGAELSSDVVAKQREFSISTWDKQIAILRGSLN